MASEDLVRQTKKAWRTRLLHGRGALPERVLAERAEALAETLGEWAADYSGGTVCAYVPIGAEPGSPALLSSLLDAGCRVLLPVVTGRSPLAWSEHTGKLLPARYGLLEPPGPRLDPSAVGEADAVLIPALAVDRRGVRLGRGAGHYDRSLPLVRPGVPLVAVVHPEEFVDELPGEEHDIRMTAVLVPHASVRTL
ncbi:5-formyltetrahydrofolate cyclo-ligase [Allokutzneria sp. A3M-2-11 16]|uniref:5-formyltetrahydrofolate cyclo-ligase n=1 Tax=Allokutzneria sp. A3M-2-11 16 TaxID=2962043 RepID=UPI0020B6E570|nr:5-formyltetrahydrofolate cyclo-ligase [Allokutzneria sp. A3M-2-11 16]MCP3800279.1 5-formyltetrahydrofolate cyclo-ligase [Allokutzneria sp. A3M-2-11 16]